MSTNKNSVTEFKVEGFKEFLDEMKSEELGEIAPVMKALSSAVLGKGGEDGGNFSEKGRELLQKALVDNGYVLAGSPEHQLLLFKEILPAYMDCVREKGLSDHTLKLELLELEEKIVDQQTRLIQAQSHQKIQELVSKVDEKIAEWDQQARYQSGKNKIEREIKQIQQEHEMAMQAQENENRYLSNRIKQDTKKLDSPLYPVVSLFNPEYGKPEITPEMIEKRK